MGHRHLELWSVLRRGMLRLMADPEDMIIAVSECVVVLRCRHTVVWAVHYRLFSLLCLILYLAPCSHTLGSLAFVEPTS